MNSAIAILSLLHQPSGRASSATRLFRGTPVLAWTVRRLAACRELAGVIVLCWDDQLAHVKQAAGNIDPLSAGERTTRPLMDMVSAARRCSEGWRVGLMGTSCWDLGFDATLIQRAMGQHNAQLAVLVDPDAGLVDPALVDQLILHAGENPSTDYVFMPAAPGLTGLLLRESLVNELAQTGAYPGRLLSYSPDRPGRDPTADPPCAPAPTVAARTLHRFVLDSQRQVDRLMAATAALNGELASSDAATLVARMDVAGILDRVPREIVLELNTARATRAIFQPTTYLKIDRENLSMDMAARLFRQAAAYDDTRLTLAGAGDPLLHPQFLKILELARQSGIASISVETDFVGTSPDVVRQLAESNVDAVSVHLPATSVATYDQVMGVATLPEVIANIQAFVQARQKQDRLTPLLVPVFTKCRQNIGEMESWYDYWLKTVGAAVIAGPRDCAGQIPDPSAVDMTPPRRVPCRRLNSRLTILSDGSAVVCEEDVLGASAVGHLDNQKLTDIWLNRLNPLREAHRRGEYPALCANCRQWHRP